MLLPSGPDMVHGFPLRRTQTSTLRARGRPYMRTASRRTSVLLERIASYRAPLIPHLARHFLLYDFFSQKSNASLPLTNSSFQFTTKRNTSVLAARPTLNPPNLPYTGNCSLNKNVLSSSSSIDESKPESSHCK